MGDMGFVAIIFGLFLATLWLADGPERLRR
jgi:hypothetical protein